MKRQMKLLQAVSKKLMKQFSGGLNETEAAYRIDAELEWVRIHWISQQLPECK